MYKYVMIIDDVSKDYIYNGTVNFQTKLASWIDTSKIDIHDLSSNPNAIEVLKNNLGNVDFNLLQENPYYIEIVKYVYNNNLKYKKYIKDSTIERHPDAVEFLKMNPKIKNDSIFENPNPDAIDLISCAIIELIDWNILSNNEYIIKKMEYLHDKSARFSTYSQSYIYDNERQIIKTLYSQINYVDLINILQDKQIIKYLEVYCDIFDSLATNPNFIYVMIYLYNNTKNIYLDSILKNPNFVEFYNNIDLDYSEFLEFDVLLNNHYATQIIIDNIDILHEEYDMDDLPDGEIYALLAKHPNAVEFIKKELYHFMDTNNNNDDNNLINNGYNALDDIDDNQYYQLGKRIFWKSISADPNYINIISENLDKVNWYGLCTNVDAIHIIQNNINKINNESILGLGGNPNAIYIIKNNLDKFIKEDKYCYELHNNPNIFTYRYDKIKEVKKYINESIIKEMHKPSRLIKFLEINDDIDDYLN